MRKTHTVLLIEDDARSAKKIKNMLHAFGYEVTHVTNREDALPIIDKGEFCLVILDLEVKLTRNAAEAFVEVGQGILEHLRERYPGLMTRRKHCLQVLMMTAHDELKTSVREMQAGVDDFLSKDFNKNATTFQDSLRNALRHSGREDHADCAAVMARARAIPEPGEEPAGTSVKITITAVPKGKSSWIEVNGQKKLLTNGMLHALLLLTISRLENEEWLESKLHGATAEGWKPGTRLRKRLEKHTQIDGQLLVENDNDGGYRLGSIVEIAPVDWKRLVKHTDGKVSAVAATRA